MTSHDTTSTAPSMFPSDCPHSSAASASARVRSIKESSDPRREGIQVIARAGTILRALERHPEGLTLSEIAKLVNLPRSTVQRIVDALDRENLVLTAAGGVRLGPALVPLAAATRFEIAVLARPFLVRLAKSTGETVDLSVLDQGKAVYLEQIPGVHRLRVDSAVGLSLPLHCSANGKALLAALTNTELEKLRKRLKLTRLTENTITSWRGLERELNTVRQHGIAFDREEVSIGISAIGAAFRGPTGELAAVSVVVPTQRFASSQKALARKVIASFQTLQPGFSFQVDYQFGKMLETRSQRRGLGGTAAAPD
jgi:IclR family transcriptional regulator, acetate operon repressor